MRRTYTCCDLALRRRDVKVRFETNKCSEVSSEVSVKCQICGTEYLVPCSKQCLAEMLSDNFLIGE